MKTITSLSELNDLAAIGKLVGLFRVPMDLYHSGPGISSSGIKEILKSPAHYKAYLEGTEDTDAFRLGRLVHMRLLEPDEYKRTVAIIPQLDARTKEGKATRDAFLKEAAGMEVVTPSEFAEHNRYYDALQANSLARKIFSGGQAELSVYWIDEATGVLCKARADYIKGELLADLKTTSYTAKKDDFKKTIKSYGYHISAPFYMDGFSRFLPVKHYAWVVVEKRPPHCFGFFAADQELLNAGRAEYQRGLQVFAECMKTQVWGGYPESFENISLDGV